ncbi:MAG: hypothetical protein JF599_12890 [Verrucomicrobia bacterium]|nr:hypothetical protein [Verrucomicrobiota bacterium]
MKTQLVTLCLALAALLGSSCASLSPHRSESDIKAELLKRTPLGSTPNEVLAFVAKNHLGELEYDKIPGFVYDWERGASNARIGVSFIKAQIGHYYEFPVFDNYTLAFWAFDQNQHLIEIQIMKGLLGP